MSIVKIMFSKCLSALLFNAVYHFSVPKNLAPSTVAHFALPSIPLCCGPETVIYKKNIA